ncbi:hypothetical protein N7540_003509 [Penicillium herquei]|nr:hypothetical protein N7540_003509 [Penicillium herquei]
MSVRRGWAAAGYVRQLASRAMGSREAGLTKPGGFRAAAAACVYRGRQHPLPLSHRSFSPAPAGSADALCERSWWAATPNVSLVAAGVSEVRGPQGPRHRWSLWTDGRWLHLTPRFPEEAALWDPPFAGVVHGVSPSTRGPYGAANPRPQGRSGVGSLRPDRR